MDIMGRLQTIDGNYLAVLLFLLPILATLVIKALNMRKNQKNILSAIDNCKNRVALNQFEDALDEYENIFKTYKLNSYNKGFILYDMGYIYYQISLTRDKEENLKQELYCYHKIINLFPDIGSLRWRILNQEKKKLIGYTMNGLARAQNDMATIRDLEEFTNASIEISIISEGINRKYNQKHQIAIAYSNLAVSYRTKYDISNNQNDFAKALKYNKWSLSLLKSMDKKSEIARIENNLGNLLMRKGILEKEEDSINRGINYLENSKKTYTIKDFPYEYARACMNIGAAYFNKSGILGSKEGLDIGIKNCENSIEIFKRLGSELDQTKASLNAIYLYQFKFIESQDIRYLEKAYEYSLKVVEVLNIISNPVLSHKGLFQKFSISFSLYSMTNEERYFYSGVDSYRLLENEKHNFTEETDEIQLMIIMSQMYFMHFSLTSNYDSLEATKKIYKEIYNNKEASKKDKFISWSRYSEILVFYEKYDSAIPEVELSVDLAKEYFEPYYSQDGINLENILSYHSEAIDQLHSIRNLIFIISEKKGNHDWCEYIDKEIHEIFSKVFNFEKTILNPSTEKVNEIFGVDFETID